MNKSGFDGLAVAAFESRMATEMTRLIERYGGRPLVAPALREIPLEHNPDALAFGEQLLGEKIDILILLTGVGTKVLIDVLQTRRSPDQLKTALGQIVLVTRGPKPTAALREFGLAPTLTVPEPNTWLDVIHTLDFYRPVKGLRVAVQEYGATNEEFLQALRTRGAEVIRVPVYRWALPEDTVRLKNVLADIVAGRVDVMLVTNAAQIDHAMQLLEQDRQVDQFRQACARMVVASIGPTASERLRHYDLPVDLEPSHGKMGILVKETSEQAHSLLATKRSG